MKFRTKIALVQSLRRTFHECECASLTERFLSYWTKNYWLQNVVISYKIKLQGERIKYALPALLILSFLNYQSQLPLGC